MREISPLELEQLIKKENNIKLIDVRTGGEFSSSHIDKSINLPIGSTEFSNYLKNIEPDAINVFICQGGTRAKNACGELEKNTTTEGLVLNGGVNAWDKQGLYLIKGKGAISMERQVRIAAGLFIFLGSLMTILGFVSFVFVPLFVGAGLVFSGVTDTCGMARVLSIMPWNNSCSTNNKSCCSTNIK